MDAPRQEWDRRAAAAYTAYSDYYTELAEVKRKALEGIDPNDIDAMRAVGSEISSFADHHQYGDTPLRRALDELMAILQEKDEAEQAGQLPISEVGAFAAEFRSRCGG